MGEKFSLAFDYKTLEALLAEDIDIAAFLKELFGDKGSANYVTMCQYLLAYQSRDEGSPEVDEFDITDSKFNTANKAGGFKCRFLVHRFYTCSAIQNQAKDNISWDFKLDSAGHLIYFTGEEPWVQVV